MALRRSNAKTFIIVRHPFTRLVSAFRDKIERANIDTNLTNDWYYKVYGKKIVDVYRKKAIAKFGQDYFNASNNFGSPVPVRKGLRDSRLPIFWEFVQYVIHTKAETDVHWKPMTKHCLLCAVDYDYVIKFENLHAEEGKWVKTILAEKSLTNEVEEYNIDESNSSNLQGSDITKLYLNTLSKNDILHLEIIYKHDFAMFDYKYDEYI